MRETELMRLDIRLYEWAEAIILARVTAAGRNYLIGDELHNLYFTSPAICDRFYEAVSKVLPQYTCTLVCHGENVYSISIHQYRETHTTRLAAGVLPAHFVDTVLENERKGLISSICFIEGGLSSGRSRESAVSSATENAVSDHSVSNHAYPMIPVVEKVRPPAYLKVDMPRHQMRSATFRERISDACVVS